MSTFEQEAGNIGSETGKLEDDILDFLDKEIATSARIGANADTNPDEVDLLINSLLQQTLAISDEQADSPEIASKDPQLSYSDFAGVSGVTSEALSAKEAQDKQQGFQSFDAGSGTSTVSDGEPVCLIAPRTPAWGGRVWIMAGAFACLLAGTGIVYFTGFRNSSPPKSDKQPSAAAQMTPSETQTRPVIRELPGKPSRNATAQPRLQVAALPVPAAESLGAAKNPVPAKKGEPAAPQLPARPGNSSSAPVPASTAASADNLPATIKARDDAAGNSAVLPAENMPPPQVVSTLPPAASTSAQLVPNVSPNLQSLGAHDKLSLPSAPLSKTVVPAEVITRVAPTYSELARRAHATGTVVIDVLVDDTGKVAKATPISGPVILHQDAINAVQRWRFKPASVDGTSVSSTSRVTVVFKQP
jgi:TonB family protein